ncbi:MAG: signal recognition particle-docking protein FtsY [candidate division WOR-3 bacterium]|nr:signal recognition particle-docking protein FtsY [candidate division WOR-3 bacterium]
MSLFQLLKNTLKKTRQIFQGVINAQSLEELEAILLSADIGVASTQYIINKIKDQAPSNYYQALIKTIKEILQKPHSPSKPLAYPLEIIMIVGVPGSGKTTTIAKLANLWQKQGKKVIISASDTYRDAAAQQLKIWAERVGVNIVFSEKGQDAGAVAFDTIQKAQSAKFDIVLIDTAGRLHTRKDLMEECKKIKRVCQKFRADAPDEIWLILDATVGQNGIVQARTFHQELNLTGVIITKLDGTAKGGVVIPVALELGLPIRYIGIGETEDAINEFDTEAFVQALLSTD